MKDCNTLGNKLLVLVGSMGGKALSIVAHVVMHCIGQAEEAQKYNQPVEHRVRQGLQKLGGSPLSGA